MFDVIVIGGGAAGMLAAAMSAEFGSSVALIEKNENISVLWILPDGSLEYGGEFEKYVK